MTKDQQRFFESLQAADKMLERACDSGIRLDDESWAELRQKVAFSLYRGCMVKLHRRDEGMMFESYAARKP